MLTIHPAVDLSTGKLLPKTYPFLAILRSIVCAILCKAVLVEVALLKPNCFLLRLSAMLWSCCICQRITRSWSINSTGEMGMVLNDLG